MAATKKKAATDPDKDKKSDKDEVLATARKRFGQAVDAHAQNRRNYIEDTIISSSDDHWPDSIKQMRGKERVMLTFNRLNPVIKQIIGDYRQNKLAAKVLPASGEASEDMADILCGLIRNIEQTSGADIAYAYSLECAARGGFGYFRFLTDYTGDDVFDQDIKIEPIFNPLTVYIDPRARKITREDANWAFITEMIPREQFEKEYPDAESKTFDGVDVFDQEDWGTGDEIRVAEYYEKVKYNARLGAFDNGIVIEIDSDEQIAVLEQLGIHLQRERKAERIKILWRRITAADILEEREYKWRYIPIVPILGEEVNIEGKVHLRGAIYYAKDAQRMLNFWKTAATESVALASKTPWLVTTAHIENLLDHWENAHKTPANFLPYNADPLAPQGPTRVEPANQPVGEMAMAMGAADDIKATTGMYDASLGARGNETSGVAINARQQEGNTATFIFLDNLKKGIEYGGRIMLDMIPTVYDTERVIRTIDMEGTPSTETVNQQQQNPLLGITTILNSITVGKYEVVIEAAPNFASKRREASDWMMKFMQSMPQLGSLVADLAVKNLDLPGADQIAERLKRALPPQITVDPDSPEGQAMAQQPPPVPPEVQMQQAEGQRKNQEMQLQHSAKMQEITLSHQAKIEQIKADATLKASDQRAQTIEADREHARKLDQMRLDAEIELKKHAMKVQSESQPTEDKERIRTARGSRKEDIEEARQKEDEDMKNSEEIKNMLGAVAQHLVNSHNEQSQQTGKLHEILGQVVNSNNAIGQHIAQSNAIAAAPRKALRHPKTGQIIGSQIDMGAQ